MRKILFLLITFYSFLEAQHYLKTVSSLQGSKSCSHGCATTPEEENWEVQNYSSCLSSRPDLGSGVAIVDYLEDPSPYSSHNFTNQLCNPDGSSEYRNSSYNADIYFGTIVPIDENSNDCINAGSLCSSGYEAEYNQAMGIGDTGTGDTGTGDTGTGTGTGDTGTGTGDTGTGSGGSSLGYGEGFEVGAVNGDSFLDNFCSNIQAEYSSICTNQGLYLDIFVCDPDTGRNSYRCSETNPETGVISPTAPSQTNPADIATINNSTNQIVASINSLSAATINSSANSAANFASIGTALSNIQTLLGGVDSGTGDGDSTDRSWTLTYTNDEGVEADGTGAIVDELKAINDTLNQGGEFNGFDTSAINATSQTDLDTATSFMDNFEDEFTELVDNATTIKSDFDNVLALVDGSGLPTSINISSSSSACDISFSLMGATFRPLHPLPSILAPFSSIFSLLVYVSVMFLNFRFLFRAFGLRG